MVNYLCFHDNSSDGCLTDIGSVQTVHTVDPEHASLFTDCILPAQPCQRKENSIDIVCISFKISLSFNSLLLNTVGVKVIKLLVKLNKYQPLHTSTCANQYDLMILLFKI